MLSDITLGQYYPGNSLLHRADPRIKIFLTFVYLAVIFLITTYTGFAMLFAFTLLGMVISGIPLKYALKGLKPLIFIILVTVFINIFFTKGNTVLVDFYFIRITLEGLDNALRLSLRLFLLIVSASMLTLTTTPIVLTDGLEKLMQPLKKIGFPAHEIAMMMTIALRFIPTLLEETDKIMKAQASRGADFNKGNIIDRAKSFIPVLVPLFVSAFRRADELAVAMEARCYKGGQGRTRMKQLKFSRPDLILMVFSLMFFAVILVLQ